MDVLVDTAASVRFELQGPNGSLQPTADTLEYTIYGNNGTVLEGPVADPSVLTYFDVPISASLNTIDQALRFEKRTIILKWISSGQTYSLRQTYRVIPFLNTTVGPDTIRALLGVSTDELSDDDVDILPSYLSLEDELTAAVFSAALVSGDLVEIRANELLSLDIALGLAPSLRTRLLMARTEGNSKVERFRSAPDFAALMDDLKARRGAALDVVLGITDVTIPTIVILTTPTDVITG